MTSFTLNDYRALPYNLTGNEVGVIRSAGELFYFGSSLSSAINITSGTQTDLQIFGIVSNGTTTGTSAIDHAGNSLYVFVGTDGVLRSTYGRAITSQFSVEASIANHGTIQSGSDAVVLTTSDAGAFGTVFNHGTIQGDSDGLIINGGNARAEVINTGSIIGLADEGVELNAFGFTGGARFQNDGYVYGGGHSVRTGDGIDVVSNSGVLNGSVELGGGADRYDGPGIVIGRVHGGPGSDTLGGGSQVDHLDGGDDDDTIVGAAATICWRAAAASTSSWAAQATTRSTAAMTTTR